MAKGIRETALSSEDDEKYPEQSPYGSQYDPYGTYSPPENMSEYEQPWLKPGEFKIEIAIPIKTLGPIGNPDKKEYNNELMLKTAEQLAIKELQKINVNTKKFTTTISSLESIDDIWVTITLKPVKS